MQMEMFNTIKMFLFGGIDVFIYALFVAMALSYLSALASAFITKQFSATKGLLVLLKKILIFLIVIAGAVIDNMFNLNFVLRNAVIIICVLNEFGGMISNLDEAGVSVPGILKNFIATAKTSAEGTDIPGGGNNNTV